MIEFKEGDKVVRNDYAPTLIAGLRPGDKGTVVHVDKGTVTVKFDTTCPQTLILSPLYLLPDAGPKVTYRIVSKTGTWTETFDRDQIKTLVRLGLISHNKTTLFNDETVKHYGVPSSEPYRVVDCRSGSLSLEEQFPQDSL